MGKKKRLNRLISRWIKSDLPEDSSTTVLLLGVTRIPTSPTPARRPCSLNLHLTPNGNGVPPPLPPNARPASVAHPYPQAADHRTDPLNQSQNQNSRPSLPSPAAATATNAAVDKTPTNDDDSPSLVVVATHDSSHDSSFGDNIMDRSVDSIGTCSLDVDASAELLSDWSENPSVDTLRSASIKSLTPQQEHRLPSYLSLACTVNGYSQITNYDPIRLAKSRDPSPHRPIIDHEQLTYAIQNNLLSPPNLVPLPTVSRFRNANATMSEHTITTTHHHHEEFYSKKMTFITRSSYIRDSVDACIDTSKYRNGGHSITNKNVNVVNGEPKSFIQQRVERLYGPGALAQGFFVMKRQKSRNSESDAHAQQLDQHANNRSCNGDKHSKSMSDKLLLDDDADSNMKQSASSPSLPVLRHLTPEFRAQLPTFSPRKGVDTILQKSTTLPQLKDNAGGNKCELPMNGHGKDSVLLLQVNNNCLNGSIKKTIDGGVKAASSEDLTTQQASDHHNDVKNGHYFIKIIDNEAQRLLGMADKAEEELDANDAVLSEDAKGFLRSAAGKARLLVSQKMQQFKGLCTNNLTQAEGEAFPTTNEDLQGFWDMVMLQVDQIDSLYKELDIMRANNWQEIIKQPIDTVDKAVNGKSRSKINLAQTTRARSAGAEEARAKREAQRKQMIEDRRKAMRDAKNKLKNESIEIFVPESS